MSAEPSTLSISVIQFTSRDHLIRCLEALQDQADVAAEIIVPHDDTLADPAALAARFPHVKLLALPGRRTPAELRSAAAAASTGAIVAFLEDHCVPDTDWARRLLVAHTAPHAAVGGAVEKGFPPGRSEDSVLDWAIYFTDYSRYMNPQPGGAAATLTDCNVSYKRADLESMRDAWAREFHENIVNGMLAKRGRTLWLAPDVVVREQRTISLGEALRDRYSFGRLFASTRVEDAPLSRRLTYAAFALVMPPVLVARVGANLFSRRRHRAQFFRALPALSLLTATWMFGEFIGYLTGRRAASLEPARAAEAITTTTSSSA